MRIETCTKKAGGTSATCRSTMRTLGNKKKRSRTKHHHGFPEHDVPLPHDRRPSGDGPHGRRRRHDSQSIGPRRVDAGGGRVLPADERRVRHVGRVAVRVASVHGGVSCGGSGVRVPHARRLSRAGHVSRELQSAPEPVVPLRAVHLRGVDDVDGLDVGRRRGASLHDLSVLVLSLHELNGSPLGGGSGDTRGVLRRRLDLELAPLHRTHRRLGHAVLTRPPPEERLAQPEVGEGRLRLVPHNGVGGGLGGGHRTVEYERLVILGARRHDFVEVVEPRKLSEVIFEEF